MADFNSHRFDDLMTAYRAVPRSSRHEPTLLEIAGWRGDEKIASNILAFFLSPVREHGWRTLLLDAFLSRVGWNGPQPDADGVLVTREVQTENGNFLDIVIEAPGILVIGIENKITADPYANPYGDYMKHLESLSRDTGAKPLLILLTPREVTCPDVGVPITCVTYGWLFQSVDSRLCDPNIDLNSRFVLRWNEFRQTMQDYSEEAKVDKDFLDFFMAHPEDMRDLLVRVEKLRIEMEQGVKASREDPGRLLGEKPKFWHFTDELRRPPGQIYREWKYLLFYSYWIDRKIPSILHHVYIGAGLFLGKGWEVQLAEGSPNGRIWEPTNLSAWLLKHGIKTHRSELMTNFLAYGDILPQVPESRAATAALFSQLIGAVNKSL